MTRRLFLRQAIRPAAAGDVQVARDLANTLFAHLSECVGMAATMIGERSASDLFDHARSTAGAQVAVASPDMLFNVFDERMGFLG